MKRYLTIVAAVLLVAAMVIPLGCRDSLQDQDAQDKAAIIDQLYLREPNPAFIAEAVAILESCGFTVDV